MDTCVENYDLQRQALQQMMMDRGYTSEPLDRTGETASSMYPRGLARWTRLQQHRCTSVNVAWSYECFENVRICLQDARRILSIFTLLDQTHDGNSARLVLTRDMPTRQSVAMLNTNDIVVFSSQCLAFNPTKHSLYDPHHRLSVSEITQWLHSRKYQVTRKDMPILLLTDPIVKYFGWMVGDVVRIQCRSLGNGPYEDYRWSDEFADTMLLYLTRISETDNCAAREEYCYDMFTYIAAHTEQWRGTSLEVRVRDKLQQLGTSWPVAHMVYAALFGV